MDVERALVFRPVKAGILESAPRKEREARVTTLPFVATESDAIRWCVTVSTHENVDPFLFAIVSSKPTRTPATGASFRPVS